MAQQDQVEEIYQPKDAVGAALKATGVTTAAGAFVSTIQNTLTKQNVGAFGIFTRTGGTIAVFGMQDHEQDEALQGTEFADLSHSCNGRSIRVHQVCFGEFARKR